MLHICFWSKMSIEIDLPFLNTVDWIDFSILYSDLPTEKRTREKNRRDSIFFSLLCTGERKWWVLYWTVYNMTCGKVSSWQQIHVHRLIYKNVYIPLISHADFWLYSLLKWRAQLMIWHRKCRYFNSTLTSNCHSVKNYFCTKTISLSLSNGWRRKQLSIIVSHSLWLLLLFTYSTNCHGWNLNVSENEGSTFTKR